MLRSFYRAHTVPYMDIMTVYRHNYYRAHTVPRRHTPHMYTVWQSPPIATSNLNEPLECANAFVVVFFKVEGVFRGIQSYQGIYLERRQISLFFFTYMKCPFLRHRCVLCIFSPCICTLLPLECGWKCKGEPKPP